MAVIRVFGRKAEATLHTPMTLRGNNAAPGIEFDQGRLAFTPRWGMTRGRADALAVLAMNARSGTLSLNVAVARTDTMPVIVPVQGGIPVRELVLVQTYRTGCGAKRFPDFQIDLGHALVLATESTYGGSGSEEWILVSAPLGWSADIANQFIDERGRPSRTIFSRLAEGAKDE